MNKYLLILLSFLLLSYASYAQSDYGDDNTYPVETVSDADVDDDSYDNNSNEDEIPDWDLRQVDKEKWEEIKNDKRFNYKKIKKKKKKKNRKQNNWDGLGAFLNSGLIKLLLYMLFGSFIIYIIYLFIKNNDLSFKKNVKDEVVVQEDPWEDVQSFDEWELALQRALADKDYRLATRIYYLHTLNILDKNEHVRFQEDKTNWYYVQKLFGGPYHHDFKGLTKSFDYIWYGEYQINEEQFVQLQSQFKDFHYKIS